jgi:hypothetical protein
MVVVPTSHDVRLDYGLSGADWVGRFVTLLAVAALGALITWKGMRRFGAAGSPDDDEPLPADDNDTGNEADAGPDAVPQPAMTPGSGGLPPPGPA